MCALLDGDVDLVEALALGRLLSWDRGEYGRQLARRVVRVGSVGVRVVRMRVVRVWVVRVWVVRVRVMGV